MRSLLIFTDEGDVQRKTAREVLIDKHPQGKIGEQALPSLMEILSAASLSLSFFDTQFGDT